MTKAFAVISGAAIFLGASSSSPSSVAAPGTGTAFQLESTIAFTSTRDNPTADPRLAAELYLMKPDRTDVRRLTNNDSGDAFPALSPDGKKLVFDSNRNRAEGEPLNTSDLFVMDVDGGEESSLTRGSSATWSPDSKDVAYHASASGTGVPIKSDPGAATSDSDIFVANVDDVLAGIDEPANVTNTPGEIEDDPDWSPDGTKLVFTAHPASDDPQLSNSAEIYVMNADGTGREQLTRNGEEERAPAWSPDGSEILFSCRIGGGAADFEICVMNADGTGVQQLTFNGAQDLTATWAPDGTRIVFHRIPPFELWVMNGDGTGQTQLTNTPGLNAFANWGELRVHEKP